MNRYLLFMGILPLVVSSCAHSTVPSLTATAIPPATELPQSALSEASTLFSGPSNVNYLKLADLPAGTSVRPAGTFYDFVKAAVVVSGKELTGFVWKEALQDLPGGLPVLGVLDVPWEPMFLPDCGAGDYDPATDTVGFSTGEGSFTSADSARWNLDAPVRVQIGKMAVDGGVQGGVHLDGSVSSGVDSSLWWQGVKDLEILAVDGMYVLWIRDGRSEDPAATIQLQRSTSQPVQILFDGPEGKSFSVLDGDNQELRHVDVTTLPGVDLPDGLFPEREVDFGVTFLGQGAVIYTGLSIGTEPQGKWIEGVDAGPGLASLAEEQNLIIGTEFGRGRMIDWHYCRAMQRDFNVAVIPEITWITPGWDFWVGPGEYHFEYADRVVEMAQQQGWGVYGSHLVWGADEAIPDWLRNGGYSRDDYIALLQQHIQTMIERYKGRIRYWSIANEAPERDFYYPTPYTVGRPSTAPAFDDFWFEKIGPEYIEMAFHWARAADPDAILVFNSGINPPPYAGDSAAMADRMYETVKALLDRGVPIDAIGTQMHLLGPLDLQVPPSKQQVLDYMKKWGDLGLRVYITELDVDLGSTPGTQEERFAYQAQIYRDIMDACLESGVCDGFMTWGVADSLSWIVSPGQFAGARNEPNGAPLLFDWNFNPKPAYFAVQDALKGIPAPISATATAPPQSGEPIDVCLARLAGPASPGEAAGMGSYDDFDSQGFDGSYDPAQWVPSPVLPDSTAQQREGVMTLGNASGQIGVGSRLVARRYQSVVLDRPMFIEADLALCPNSSAGGVNVGISAIGFLSGSWTAGCDMGLLSSELTGGCMDFLWSPQAGEAEDQFETTRQVVEPGTWHRVRIEVDPATMTLSYSIDGAAAGSHTPANAEGLKAAQYQFAIGLWKSSTDSPLLGLVDNVRIGPIAP